MIETKSITVLLNINPRYFHPNLIYKHINEQLEKMTFSVRFGPNHSLELSSLVIFAIW